MPKWEFPISLLERAGVADYIADQRERRNALISITDGMLYSVMGGLTSPFWGAFAVRLGASDYMLALLSSLPAIAGLLAQTPSALLVDRFPNRLRPTLLAAFAERSFFLLFALLAIAPIPLGLKPLIFVLLYSLRNVPATMAGIAWTSMMGEMFSPSVRGDFFGERNMLCTLATLFATLVAGPYLDRAPWPWNYFSLYLLSLCAVMGSLYYLTKHTEDSYAAATPGRPQAGDAFRSAFSNRGFIRFLAAVAAIHIGFHVPASLWTILWVKIMGLSNAWLGTFSIVSGVASALSYRAWGRWSSRYGNGKILTFTAVLHIAFPLVYAHFRSPYVYAGLNVVGGFAGAGLSLALFNGLLESSPPSGRPAYIAIYNTVLGVSGFLWPFLGVWLYRKIGMVQALDFSAMVRIAGIAVAAILLIRRDRPSRASSPESSR